LLEDVAARTQTRGADHEVVVVVDGEHEHRRRPRQFLQARQHLEAGHVG